MRTKTAAQQRQLASSPFQPRPEAAIEEFAVHDRVSHDQYGLGRVVSAEAGAVTVDFGSGRIRIVSPFLRMEKL
ncbi:MAG: hypothetical protein ACXVW2_02860 [Nocardioidaceae bacterium]